MFKVFFQKRNKSKHLCKITAQLLAKQSLQCTKSYAGMELADWLLVRISGQEEPITLPRCNTPDRVVCRVSPYKNNRGNLIYPPYLMQLVEISIFQCPVIVMFQSRESHFIVRCVLATVQIVKPIASNLGTYFTCLSGQTLSPLLQSRGYTIVRFMIAFSIRFHDTIISDQKCYENR